jgi:hypothetical protein
MPKLKMQLYDSLTFRQKQNETVDEWANKVRLSAQVLTTNGHPISDQEKTLIFRSGLLDEEVRNALIMPARTEDYETFLLTARTFLDAHSSASSSSSNKVFLTSTALCP